MKTINTLSLHQVEAGPPQMLKDGCGAILVVGPNEADLRAIRDLLLKMKIANPIDILPVAAELLSDVGPREHLALKDKLATTTLILLDLSNKHETGFGILRWFYGHSDHGVPIAILIGRAGMNQLKRAYQLGATTFLRRPLSPVEFQAMAENLKLPISYLSDVNPASNKPDSK
jgi:CheY-like chemotaxis protein